MSTTRYTIRLWEYDGEAPTVNAVSFLIIARMPELTLKTCWR